VPTPKKPAVPSVARAEVFQTVQALWLVRKNSHDMARTYIEERLRKEPMFKKATRTTLDTRGWDFFFSQSTGPSSAVRILLDAVRALPDQGLSTGKYPIRKIEDAAKQIRDLAEQVSQARSRMKTSRAWTALGDVLEGDSPPMESTIDGLFDTGRLNHVTRKGLATLESAFRNVLDLEKGLNKARADLEVSASVAFFRFALDMKFLKVASPFQADDDPSVADITHLDQLVGAFDAFAVDPGNGIKALTPSHPYYAATVAGLATYREMEKEGPFPKVPSRGRFRKGSRGKAVLALKKRLAREGYFDGDLNDNRFGDDLEESVRQYQSTHGFIVNGVVEKGMLRSLNVPLSRRISQIRLSLQRWRESDVRADEELYVRVNIPEFMMEVWDQGKLVMKHEVVVGNNIWDHDPDGGWEGRINRTKIFSAEISRVVLNPRWYVPKRIHRLDLDFQILSRPDYYVEHNYKVEVLPDGREKVYQDSGDENALGRVKFVFPNPYGIFMHDTPQKRYFKKEIRAYSHGCVRLKDPMEVAYYLLKRRKGMDKKAVDRILKAEKIKAIDLDEPVPIFVEYNSVGVDDKGRMMFFSDVYRYDRDYFAGKIPYSEEELNLLKKKIQRIY